MRQSFFPFKVEYYFIVWLDDFVFSCASVEGYLDCYHILAVVTKAALNMEVQTSVQVSPFSSLFPQWLHRFTLLTAMHGGSDFSTSSPTFLMFCFSVTAMLVDVKRYLMLVLICTSLMVGHLFLCLMI